MNQTASRIINNTLNSSITITQYQAIVQDKYNHADKYQDICADNNIKYITFEDKEYPKSMKKDGLSPAIIFYQGNIKLLKSKSIAIVGSRATDIFCQQLIADCIPRIKDTIISGMAYGVDILAHQNALDNKKSCIAVLPCGLLKIVFYPQENWDYKDRIINSGGLVISQLLPDSKPLRYTFIQRNRVIAQLSKQVWIVKAALKSGTLTTANYALELNKKLLVTTYNQYDESYKGNYELINKGAMALVSPDYFGPKIVTSKLSKDEKEIIDLIKKGHNDIDSISEKIDYIKALKILLNLVKSKSILEQDGLYYVIEN